MKFLNITLFQALSIDGNSQLSFNHDRFDIHCDDKFVFIKSLKSGQLRGTTFANLQAFIPIMEQESTPKPIITISSHRKPAISKMETTDGTAHC